MTSNKKRLLLVEDEESLGYLLSEYLGMKGFQVTWAKDGEEALELMEKGNFDLAILDVMMPRMDGFALAERMRINAMELPFLFLTARSLKIDVLKGFALGAVDYLKKPIDEEELVVRIHTLLSRLIPEDRSMEQEILVLGQYQLDCKNQKLIFEDDFTTLTTREMELLRILAINKNNLCTHKEILIKLWGDNDYFNRKSLNVFITRLRNYLKKDDTLKIENVHGKGFILRIPNIA
ncbi:response regulator transcription factor [Flavobacteriaceae bacterium GF1]